MNILLIVLIIIAALLLCVGLSIASFSGAQLVEVYKKISVQDNSRHLTAADFALFTNLSKFNNKLKITTCDGMLTDHFTPSSMEVSVSKENLNNTSIAGITIVAHEFGHADQFIKEPKVYKRFLVLLKLGRIFGFLMLPMLILGIVFILIGGGFLIAGITCSAVFFALFILSLSIKLYTISMEKEASKRGMKMLEEYFNEDELKKAKKLLKAAKLTYWGDFFRAILSWTMLTGKAKFF